MEQVKEVANGNRVLYLDLAKAFAIICVILGHVIQFYDDNHEMKCVYDVIYSFHMPLFMTLSGFFISKSLDTRIDKVIFHKGRQLLVPVLSFTLLAFAVSFITPFDMTKGLGFFAYISGGDMWFLKYLFGCILIACVSKLLFRNTLIAALIPMLILISVSRVGIFRIYPFLWLGFFLHCNRDKIEQYSKQITIVSLLVFLILLMFWHVEYDYPRYRWITIKHGVSFDWFALYVVTYRFLIGAVGSISAIALFKFLPLPKVIKNTMSFIGKRTLGIYCLQIYLLEHAARYYPHLQLHGVWNVVYVLLLTIVFTALCVALVWCLEKSKLTSFLFLGKKYRREL